MMLRNDWHLMLLALVAIVSCAPVRNVVPLSKGAIALTGTFGGPAVGARFWGQKVPAPLPLSSLSIGYGVTNDVTSFASIYPTAMSFGNMQLEAGTSIRVWSHEYVPFAPTGLSPLHGLQVGVSIQPAITLLGDVWGSAVRAWPTLDAQIYLQYQPAQDLSVGSSASRYDQSNYWYIGSCNWFELSSRLSGGNPVSHHWLPGVDLGHVLRFESIDVTTELRYLAIGIPNHNPLLDYQGINERGTFGMYIGLSWRGF